MVVTGSIRGTVRERILEALNGVNSPQKILILDGSTVKVIDASVTMAEILDTGVFLIENLTLGRQPYPNMAAVYLVGATDEAVQTIARDFTPPTRRLVSGRTGPCYGEAHVFLTTGLSESQLQKLAESAAAPYVRSLQELYLDFCPLEARVFHAALDRLRAFNVLFGEGGGGGEMGKMMSMDLGAPEPPLMARQLELTAMRIAAACIVMGEVPKIRYRRSPGDGRSGRLAMRVQKQLEELSVHLSKSTNFPGKKGSTLLIVDRTVDLLVPLLHEFTMQAMATDLLDLGPDGTRYEYSYSTIGGPVSRTVSLDPDRDALWSSLRHAHVADCSRLIIERFNRFVNENKAAVKVQASKEVQAEKVTSLAELKDTMAALGEFQEMKSEFALHLSLAQACLAASDQKRLIEVAGVEQDVATGTTAEGEPIKGDIWNRIAAFLDRPALSSAERARLLGIYLLTTPNVAPNERRALFDLARLDESHQRGLNHLVSLAGGRPYKQRPSGKPRGSRRKSCLDEAPAYDVSRYVPAVKLILEDAIFDELDPQEFPMVKTTTTSTDDSGSINRAAPAATSLRARPHGTATGSGSGSVPSTPTGPANGSIFIYIIGGATYSEMRSIYELSDSLKRDIYLGADNIITPADFLENLQSS